MAELTWVGLELDENVSIVHLAELKRSSIGVGALPQSPSKDERGGGLCRLWNVVSMSILESVQVWRWSTGEGSLSGRQFNKRNLGSI